MLMQAPDGLCPASGLDTLVSKDQKDMPKQVIVGPRHLQGSSQHGRHVRPLQGLRQGWQQAEKGDIKDEPPETGSHCLTSASSRPDMGSGDQGVQEVRVNTSVPCGREEREEEKGGRGGAGGV